MGVEPTTDTCAGPVTGFEDRGIHRDTSIPVIANTNRKRERGQTFNLPPQNLRAICSRRPCLGILDEVVGA
jgi:hypothetical protein